MKKEEILGHLRAAKSAHIQWVQRAKLLISGVDVEKDSIPVNSTECKFGKWFYSDGQILNSLANNPLECMQEIEQLHMELHDQYLKIFTIYFSKEKQGFFAKLFGFSKREVTRVEQDLAEEHYAKMDEISKKLLEEINRLERRIVAVPDEKLAELV